MWHPPTKETPVKRFLALVPAVVLVLGLVPVAQAGTLVGETTTLSGACLGNTADAGTEATAVVTLYPDQRLRKVTVSNPCHRWAWLRMWGGAPDEVGKNLTYILLEPGATRTIGHARVEKLGISDVVYTNGGVRAPGRNISPCEFTGVYMAWVLQDGRVTNTRPPC
jgi:hypothetical protein